MITGSEEDKRKARTGPKRSNEERDAIGVLAAKLHYEEGRSLEDVQERLAARGFDVRSARDVGLAIRRAIDNQLCKVRVDVFAEASAVSGLSDELAKAAGIRRALVAATAADPNLSDGDLHRRLGDLAARFLWQSSLRPGDRIGVGPGRGVGCTVHELSPLVPERLPYAGHHLATFRSRATAPVQAQLDRLAGEVWPEAPAAVIDLCEHYLVGDGVPAHLAGAVEEIVAALNERVIAVAPSILARARERILVAGGRCKYPALLAALTAVPDMRPTTLVTDEGTARRLLEVLPERS